MWASSSVKDLRNFPWKKPEEHVQRSEAAHAFFPKQSGTGYQITEGFLTEQEHSSVMDAFRRERGSLNKQPQTMLDLGDIRQKINHAVVEFIGISDLEGHIKELIGDIRLRLGFSLDQKIPFALCLNI